ncbi:MAG: hypothetical protein BGO43_07160 [Gammaproteobacteria bacterium 39-13]|nr:L,D-transpeptidase family protein [Gammaproteobacteria bacterium]OJV88367.1 MAG: hypothetical protein BGO43_07160 [Gammaproteobacteria bacterium 39-13]
MRAKVAFCIKFLFLIVILWLVGYLGYRYFYMTKEVESPQKQAIPKAPPVKLSKIDYILIEKKKRQMTVFHKDKPLRVYRIALGFSPVGHKTEQGDGKTPEGMYKIVAKNPKSRFHLSIKISYPSTADRKIAAEKGVHPGGEIMIHGLGAQGFLGEKHRLRDWTLGCIAVTNEEITEVYPYIDVGTKVEIRP